MGILRETVGSDGHVPVGESATTAGAAPAPPRSLPTPAGPDSHARAADGSSDLRRRRDELAAEVTELHWDLGGLAYEMAIRDHFRLDVLVRRAAVLQERDAELAELERLLRMEDGAVAGNCPQCSAPHSRGALYCWQCGVTLMQLAPSAAASDPDSEMAAMDASLAPDGANARQAFGASE